MALLERLWDSSCAPTLIPFTKLITYALVVFSLFGGFRFFGALPMFVYSCHPILAIVFLFELFVASILMSRMFIESSKLKKNSLLLQFHDGSNEGKVFSKNVRSLRPLRCNMGRFYFIDRATPLTVLSGVLDSFISLLLAI